MTEAHQNTLPHQCRNQLWWHAVRCQRQHHRATLNAGKLRYVGFTHLADEAGRMGTLALNIEKWSFDVNAENARMMSITRCLDRRNGLGKNTRRIGDDRRQHARRSERAMGAGNPAHRFNTWIIIEQCAATAIHLYIDEAGRQKPAVQGPPFEIRCNFAFWFDIGDPGTIDNYCESLTDRIAIENPGPGECKSHQTVSVTFLSNRGLSGSRPRARAAASINR